MINGVIFVASRPAVKFVNLVAVLMCLRRNITNHTVADIFQYQDPVYIIPEYNLQIEAIIRISNVEITNSVLIRYPFSAK